MSVLSDVLDNLSSILVNDCGLLAGDLSTDQRLATSALFNIDIVSHDFVINLGEKLDVDFLNINLKIIFVDKLFSNAKSRAIEYVHLCRENIKVDNMNVSGLLADKTVASIEHTSPKINYEDNVIEIDYNIILEYYT